VKWATMAVLVAAILFSSTLATALGRARGSLNEATPEASPSPFGGKYLGYPKPAAGKEPSDRLYISDIKDPEWAFVTKYQLALRGIAKDVCEDPQLQDMIYFGCSLDPGTIDTWIQAMVISSRLDLRYQEPQDAFNEKLDASWTEFKMAKREIPRYVPRHALKLYEELVWLNCYKGKHLPD
jgi:hypothetical protein